MATLAGIVKSLNGVVKARAEGGTERVLQVGDMVYEGEQIIVERVDGRATIALANGEDLSLGEGESFTFVTGEDLTDLQKAVMGEGDILEEDTAAGGEEARGGLHESGEADYAAWLREYDAIQAGRRNPLGRDDTDRPVIEEGAGLANEAPVAVDDIGVAVEEGSGGEYGGEGEGYDGEYQGYGGEGDQYDPTVPAVGNVLANDTDDGEPNGDLDVVGVTSNDTSNTAAVDGDGNFIITGQYGILIINGETGGVYISRKQSTSRC